MPQPSYRSRVRALLVAALLTFVAGCRSATPAPADLAPAGRAPAPLAVDALAPADLARHDAALTEAPAAPHALPLRFIENRGQLAEDVAFAARSGGISAELRREGITLHLRDGLAEHSQLTLRFLGASPDAALVGDGEPQSRVHYYRGAQPEAWVTDVPAFGAVRWRDLHAGVDLALRDGGGRLEYDLLLEPGACLDDVVIEAEGALELRLGEGGTLLARTPTGTLVQDIPATWQVLPDGTRQPLDAHFRLLGGTRFGFSVPGRDASLALVLDPGLTYSSYLGGSNWDRVQAVARGPDGSVYLAGYSVSADFPTTDGAQQRTLAGFGDAFVARMDLASGALLWSTFLGGADGLFFVEESARALAVDASGAAWVAGTANSPNFPVTPGAWQPALAGGTDGFVAKLGADGTLAASTYLGGSKDDAIAALALGAGGVFVAGRTASDAGVPFPTTPGAFDTSFNSIFFTSDAFVTRLAPDLGSLAWSTLLGGVLRDEAQALAVDAAGAVTVTGLTGSNNFPTTAGAFDTTFNGASANKLDAFVTRLAPDGATLAWSTYLGGAESDEGRALALDASGGALVAGVAASTDFPVTAGALQTVFGGGATDAFIARLSGDGGTLSWSSLLGGSGDDAANALALSSGGQATLAGATTSPDFPVTAGAVGSGNAGGSDAFLVRLSPDGALLRYGGTFGGLGDDRALALALDVHGAGLLGGDTMSTDLPVTPGANDTSANGGGDGFVARIELPPWSDLGFGKPGTAGKVPLLVGGGSLEPGTPGTLTLTNARPNSLAFLFIGVSAGYVPVKGGTLVPYPVVLTVQLVTLAGGGFPLAFPAWPAGLPSGFPIYFQFWISDPAATGGVSSSNAVRGTQP